MRLQVADATPLAASIGSAACLLAGPHRFIGPLGLAGGLVPGLPKGLPAGLPPFLSGMERAPPPGSFCRLGAWPSCEEPPGRFLSLTIALSEASGKGRAKQHAPLRRSQPVPQTETSRIGVAERKTMHAGHHSSVKGCRSD